MSPVPVLGLHPSQLHHLSYLSPGPEAPWGLKTKQVGALNGAIRTSRKLCSRNEPC